MPVPTLRLAVVAAALIVVQAVVGWELVVGLLVLDGVLLVAAIADWILAPRPGRVTVERDFPPVVVLGHRARLVWHLRSRTSRPQRVRFADEVAPSLRAADRRFDVRLPAGGRGTVSTPIQPARRGRFPFRELAVRVDGPLGLIARQHRDRRELVLRIHPAFPSRPDAELRLEKARVLQIGLRSAKGRGGGTDFDQLRDYTVDDEFRRLDWAATARTGRPIVRTYRAERNQTVVVLLDNGRTMAGRVVNVPRVEHAMDAALCLVTVATGLGDRCGLIAYDREVRRVVPASSSRAQLSRITSELYDLTPALAESDYRAAFLTALTRFRRRTLFVLLGELSSATMQESLLPALPLIARRHAVVHASVRDPVIEAWADDGPDDVDDTYRKVAAIEALEERQLVAAELRSRGVAVIDAPPGRLAPELADHYLEVKATGQL